MEAAIALRAGTIRTTRYTFPSIWIADLASGAYLWSTSISSTIGAQAINFLALSGTGAWRRRNTLVSYWVKNKPWAAFTFTGPTAALVRALAMIVIQTL